MIYNTYICRPFKCILALIKIVNHLWSMYTHIVTTNYKILTYLELFSISTKSYNSNDAECKSKSGYINLIYMVIFDTCIYIYFFSASL